MTVVIDKKAPTRRDKIRRVSGNGGMLDRLPYPRTKDPFDAREIAIIRAIFEGGQQNEGWRNRVTQNDMIYAIFGTKDTDRNRMMADALEGLS